MDKAALRLDIKNRLEEITEEKRIEKSRSACLNLISTPQFRQASVVMMYMAFPYETDAADAIVYAWQNNKKIAVPKVNWNEKNMSPVLIDSLEENQFSLEKYGLKNPVNGETIELDSIDLVVTPAIGYDNSGNRLGHGGGYYDGFFAEKNLKAIRCGFVFSEQIIDSVPVNEWDKTVDMVVTDQDVIYCIGKNII